MSALTIRDYAGELSTAVKAADTMLKSGMIPSHYKTVEAVMTAIWWGQELGMSPIRALNSIVIIQGKCTLEAQALKALAIGHGAKIQTVEWSESICTLKCARGDWTEILSFSMSDAERQGLTGKDNWRRMPRQMLYARCVSMLIRNMFADVIGGVYSREEIEDTEDRVTGEVIDVTPEPTPEPRKWLYRIDEMEESQLPKALTYLEANRAVWADIEVAWVSPVELKRLSKYEVMG